jgi:hypothetical protein
LREYFSGRLVIEYDRFVAFLLLGLAVGISLWMNLRLNMLPSFALLMIFYFSLTLRRWTTPQRYRKTLQSYQFLALIISIIAIVQFLAQFVVDGQQLINFYGIIPEALTSPTQWTTVRMAGNLLKANGLFLGEASEMSQVAGLALLIEVLEFGRPRYLALLGLGWLLAYSGTGVVLVAVLLPFVAIRERRARWPAALLVAFTAILMATGAIDLSAFTSRTAEFSETRASGFLRFISPFWMTQAQFQSAPLMALLIGNGPGTVAAYVGSITDYTGFPQTWFKMFYEYGIVGVLMFVLFLASALRRSACPGLVLAALMFIFLFLGGELLSAAFLIKLMVLCTLNRASTRETSGTGVGGWRRSVTTGGAAPRAGPAFDGRRW